jgi:hypothetical protein
MVQILLRVRSVHMLKWMSHSHRTPSRRKPEDEETCKAYHRCRCALGVLWIFTIKREMADRSEDEEADKHPCRAGKQRFTTTVVLDDVETVESHAEVDAILRELVR